MNSRTKAIIDKHVKTCRQLSLVLATVSSLAITTARNFTNPQFSQPTTQEEVVELKSYLKSERSEEEKLHAQIVSILTSMYRWDMSYAAKRLDECDRIVNRLEHEIRHEPANVDKAKRQHSLKECRSLLKEAKHSVSEMEKRIRSAEVDMPKAEVESSRILLRKRPVEKADVASHRILLRKKSQ